MAKGDHLTNNVYLENALYMNHDAVLAKLLPPVSVTLEEDDNDFILRTETDDLKTHGIEILRFPQTGELAKNLQKAGAQARIMEIFSFWESAPLYEGNRQGDYIRRTLADFQEIIEIADDFDFDLNEVLK